VGCGPGVRERPGPRPRMLLQGYRQGALTCCMVTSGRRGLVSQLCRLAAAVCRPPLLCSRCTSWGCFLVRLWCMRALCLCGVWGLAALIVMLTAQQCACLIAMHACCLVLRL
jgi:hypothetical protein